MKANVLQFLSHPLDDAHCDTRRLASIDSVGVDEPNIDHHCAASRYSDMRLRKVGKMTDQIDM